MLGLARILDPYKTSHVLKTGQYTFFSDLELSSTPQLLAESRQGWLGVLRGCRWIVESSCSLFWSRARFSRKSGSLENVKWYFASSIHWQQWRHIEILNDVFITETCLPCARSCARAGPDNRNAENHRQIQPASQPEVPWQSDYNKPPMGGLIRSAREDRFRNRWDFKGQRLVTPTV